jgi:hypothetical protein
VEPDPSLAGKRTANNDPAAPSAPKNSFPRLAVDSEGVVYLAYRRPFGVAVSTSTATGSSVGSIWGEQMIYFDGAQWTGPGTLAGSDGLLDNRPAITAIGPGQLLIAQANDHRLSPGKAGTAQNDPVQSDVNALEVAVARTAKAAQLPPHRQRAAPAACARRISPPHRDLLRRQKRRPAGGRLPLRHRRRGARLGGLLRPR